ncbi:hypothetical protein HDV03_004573 [Kappamyces sp. JEL0829]|nr:hypothetical protein HDV03_004573 [Kappamyces sp. JEL0829]
MSSEAEKIEAAMCSRFLMETFRSDLADSQDTMRRLVEKQVDILETAPDSLKIHLITNIGISGVTLESALQSLIVCLASTNKGVVHAAVDALANFGVSTSDDLESKMNEYHMFSDFKTVAKEKFVHPLDVCPCRAHS